MLGNPEREKPAGLEGEKQAKLAVGSGERARAEVDSTITDLRAKIVELGEKNPEEARKLAARIELLEQGKREIVP